MSGQARGTVERGDCECGTEPAITWGDDGAALGALCLADLDAISPKLGSSETERGDR